MNGYPFAGPGGQKTLHRQGAEHANPVCTLNKSQRDDMRIVNGFALALKPYEVYAVVMEVDNR